MATAIVLTKVCSGCLESKPAASFSPHVNTKDRLQPKCKACRNLLQNAKGHSHRKNPVSWRDHYSADRRREDKRKYYLANKQATIDRASEWAKKNPAAMAARAMHRLALQRKATPSWADLALIESIYVEAKRLEAETGVKWHVDHAVPPEKQVSLRPSCAGQPGFADRSREHRKEQQALA